MECQLSRSEGVQNGWLDLTPRISGQPLPVWTEGRASPLPSGEVCFDTLLSTAGPAAGDKAATCHRVPRVRPASLPDSSGKSRADLPVACRSPELQSRASCGRRSRGPEPPCPPPRRQQAQGDTRFSRRGRDPPLLCGARPRSAPPPRPPGRGAPPRRGRAGSCPSVAGRTAVSSEGLVPLLPRAPRTILPCHWSHSQSRPALRWRNSPQAERRAGPRPVQHERVSFTRVPGRTKLIANTQGTSRPEVTGFTSRPLGRHCKNR